MQCDKHRRDHKKCPAVCQLNSWQQIISAQLPPNSNQSALVQQLSVSEVLVSNLFCLSCASCPFCLVYPSCLLVIKVEALKLAFCVLFPCRRCRCCRCRRSRCPLLVQVEVKVLKFSLCALFPFLVVDVAVAVIGVVVVVVLVVYVLVVGVDGRPRR